MMKLHAVEGNTLRLDGGAMFGHAPKVLWEQWFQADDKNRIGLACRSLLLQTSNGRNILFEAGVGAFFEPKLKERYGVSGDEHLLLKNLKPIGLEENDIDTIILSHLHFDHAGGLLAAYDGGPLRLLFPKAKYYLSSQHCEYAKHPHIREQVSFIPGLQQLLERSNRLVLMDGPSHPDLDFGVSFKPSEGHSIGLYIAEIDLPSGPLVFASDLVPGIAWVHLPLVMGYDRFPERKIDEKKALYDSILPRNGKLFFTHDPSIPCAALRQDPKGKFFPKETLLSSL